MSEVTRLLGAIERGEPTAASELLPLVYGELRRLAEFKLAREAPGQTLQPTALVHEAWIRLAGSEKQEFAGRAHFLGAAAEAMRRILIDKARRKHRVRHGHGLIRVDFEHLDLAVNTDDETLLRLDDALKKLAAEDSIKAELIKLRFFVGLNIREAGEVLGFSESTAKRCWNYARAWLYAELNSSE